MKNYIDLHMHSHYSDDGEYTPSQLVDMCDAKGIKIMAIADHNSVKGVEEGKRRAKELGIRFISAIEVDCIFSQRNFHLLGYGIDETNDIFQRIEENVMNQELDLSVEKIKLTNELGFQVSKDELDTVSDNGIYTGEMFGEVILAKEEYKEHPLLMPYREGGSRSDNPYVNFYWDFYAQGKPCYTKVEYPKLEDVIDIIHQHGGKAVLAHPGANLKGEFTVFDDMVQQTDLDGVEAFSNYHDEKTADYFYKKGQGSGLMITCGSDFHGKTKPAIELGESHCPYDQEFIEEFFS